MFYLQNILFMKSSSLHIFNLSKKRIKVKQIIIQHFKKRAKYYDKLGIWVKNPLIMQKTLEFMDLGADMKIIDIGAGTSVVLQKVLSIFSSISECVALDISKEMLSKISHIRIKKCLHDAHEIPFPSHYFDVALCRQSLHYMEDAEKVIQEIHRVLVVGGALVIGQITPFCEKDEEYWKSILHIRQPLRKHFLTLDVLITLLKKAPFKITRISQIRGEESLNSWLSKYKTPYNQIAHVRSLHYNAPSIYKRIHNFRETKEDIVFNNCWTFIRAIKK